MMKYLFLGVVQGLTEFLPVSSSAHLVIFQKLLNLPVNLAFDVVVHLATLLAVVAYFWQDLLEIIKWFLVGLYKVFTRNLTLSGVYHRIALFKMSILLLVATLVTAVIGFTFQDYFESLFSSTCYVGAFLLLTALLMLMAERIGKGRRDAGDLNFWDALVIGLAQAAAIAPGLSRSGTTISAGLMRNFKRPLAARFSFLLSVPTILGAGLLESKKVMAAGLADGWWPLIIGGVAAFISGYLSIWFFMGLIKRISLKWFAYYCIAAGTLVLLLHFFKLGF